MKKIVAIAFIIISTVSYSQKGKILEGSFKNLKGIGEYNLVFDYSDLQVNDFNSEEDFLEDKVNKREKKEIGLGQKFKKEWFSDRPIRYEPRFIKSFNEYFKKKEVQVVKDLNNREYTLKVHTTYIYPGYNVGVAAQESKIDAIIYVYKTDAPTEILLKIEIKGSKGHYQGDKAVMRGYEFHTGERIGYAYWTLGKYFAKRLRMGIK